MPPRLKKQTTVNYLRKLEKACEWLGLERGRARDYLRLLNEFYEDHLRSEKHILSYYESYEIVEMYEFWKIRTGDFPGLYGKLREACRSGPVLREGENLSSSSNRPRNDAFGFLMAGKFLGAGICVESVEKVPSRSVTAMSEPVSNADFSFSWKGASIDVECKRIHSRTALLKRAKEARRQIERGGRCGIIAIDCSKLYRPSGTLLEADSMTRAENDQSEWLEADIMPEVSRILPKAHAPSQTPSVLGFVLYSRIPAMTATGVLDSKGSDLRRSDCISSFLVVRNRFCPDPSVLQEIHRLLVSR